MNFLAYTIVHFLKQENNSTDESKSRLHITDMKKNRLVRGMWLKTVKYMVQ